MKKLCVAIILVLVFSSCYAEPQQEENSINSENPHPIAEQQETLESSQNTQDVLPSQEKINVLLKNTKNLVGLESEKRQVIEDAGRYGFTDLDGTVVIEPKYEAVTLFESGISVVVEQNTLCIIDSHGADVLRLTKDVEADKFGLVRFDMNDDTIWWEENKSGYINLYGDVKIYPIYKLSGTFQESYVIAIDNYMWGALNKNGKVIIPFEYDYLGGFSEGLCGYKINEKAGFIDSSNNIIIPASFDKVDSFSNGIAIVYPVYKTVWVDIPESPMEGESFTLFQPEYIDTKGNTLYKSEKIISKSYEENENVEPSNVYTQTQNYIVYSFDSSVTKTININGYWGFNSYGEKRKQPNRYFYWGEYQDEPIYEVVDAVDISIQLYSSDEMKKLS